MTASYLSPDLRQTLDRLWELSQGSAGSATSSAGAYGTSDRVAAHLAEVKPEMESVVDRRLDGPDGQTIRVRIYDPGAVGNASPALIYFHGGLFPFDRLEDSDHVCCYLAESSQLHVASVDYRSPTEHARTAALDDCETAVRWLLEHGSEWGFDPGCLAVGGESTGAAFALRTSLRLANTGAAPIRALFLLYGRYDSIDSSLGLDKRDEAETRPPIEFLRPAPAAETVCEDSLLTANLRTLPFIYLVGCTADSLRDQSRRLADRARQQQQEHCFVEWPGMTHGCLRLIRGVPELETHLDAMSALLRGVLSKEDR